MEKEDGGTTICETQETNELEQYFAWFTSDLYRLTPLIYADHVSAEDFIAAHKNPLWEISTSINKFRRNKII